jgi:hypothetical protein
MPSIILRFQEQLRKIDPRLILVLAIALLIFTSGYTSFHTIAAEAAVTPTPSVLTPTPAPVILTSTLGTATPFPPEYLTNEEQTVGPTVAAALLVLVVVAGVLPQVFRHPRDD